VSNLKNWAVILPAHNSAGNICNTVSELESYFQINKLSGQVVIVENGSIDNTWDVINSIDSSNLPFSLVRTRSEKGLGNAIRKGLENVITDFVLITADDLPFGFSDIDGYRKSFSAHEIAIGSKAHPDTDGDRSLSREIMSTVFRTLRRIIVGVNLGDTQGTIMGQSSVICPISSQTHQTGYLMTTEFLAIATRAKRSIIEIPVQYRHALRGSNIKVVEDSISMLKGLFEVRRQLQIETIK
jgi:glycosyltransferase involved in cell wall biosynthesis